MVTIKTIEPDESEEEKETGETEKDEPRSVDAKSKFVLTWARIKRID